jgi:hypothetical protein
MTVRAVSVVEHALAVELSIKFTKQAVGAYCNMLHTYQLKRFLTPIGVTCL